MIILAQNNLSQSFNNKKNKNQCAGKSLQFDGNDDDTAKVSPQLPTIINSRNNNNDDDKDKNTHCKTRAGRIYMPQVGDAGERME